MAVSEVRHLQSLPNPEALPEPPYLESIKSGQKLYGRMSRSDQDRNILLTPENIALFSLANIEHATAQDLVDEIPELSYCSTHIILDRLEDMKQAQQTHPEKPVRPVAFFTKDGQFFDQAILKDIKEPVPHAKPHQKHIAHFAVVTAGGEIEELPPIPVGQIYTMALALPSQKILREAA